MRGWIVAARNGGIVEAQSLKIWIFNGADGGATVTQRLPSFLNVRAERGNGSDTGDSDAKWDMNRQTYCCVGAGAAGAAA